MNAPEEIEIRRLKLSTFIGVPDDERSAAQELLLTVRMVPALGFEAMEDRIENTIDYAAVAIALQEFALAKPRQLIETLVSDIAGYLLSRYPISRVKLMLEKFILPDAECVAVHLEKTASHQG